MRIFVVLLSIGMTVLLLGCVLLNGGQESSKGADSTPVTTRESAEPPSVVSAVPSPMATPESAEQAQPMVSAVSPPATAQVSYFGPTSLEERIVASPVIARVRLDSVTSTAESGPTFRGMKYFALIEFNFSVLEYLKGSGANDIVAVWAAAPLFDTRQEADAALPAIATARDAQWDNHEAIVFLQHSMISLASTEQADRYSLSWGGSWTIPDDGYSIASLHDKLWLPAEAAVGAPSQPSGDQQRFLLDVPPASGTAPTTTLGEIKTRIAGVAAKLDAGDGSEEYRECVQRTYQFEGRNRYSIETGGGGYASRTPDHELDSGLAASSVVYEESPVFGDLPDKKGRTWLDGGDADLFGVESGDAVPYDFSGDGVNDSIYFARRVVSARPLPAGVYRFHFNDVWAAFVPCDGYTIRYEWTVTVTAPEDTLHEAFFDPVTVGTAALADSTNGVLKPAEFTDTNGASATIDRVAWEAGTGDSGTVELKLSPHNGIAGHIVEFIALDGTVSLSLNVADATVDPANDTLSWMVASQPWQSGDKLMLRIRRAPPQ